MNHDTNNNFGVFGYIVCCIFSLFCWALVGYVEVLTLQQKTEARIQAIDMAVQKMDRMVKK